MAWWQKKLLRYALSRTGFLDDNAIDLDNLDVAFGKQNVFQFKDVGLNIKRISKLAQLPPSLRVETARVLSLRLTVPADIYQSSIVAEVDGVELGLRLEEQDEPPAGKSKGRARSPGSTRNPQHRKMHRRLHSPPPYDPGGLGDSDDHLPTTEEMAKSFLMDEPARERRELEASVAAQAKGMEESIASESSSSEGAEYGTGATIGVPGFLAGFLQGIVDRLRISVKNIRANVDTILPGDGGQTIPVTLRLHVGDVEFGSTLPLEPSESNKSLQSPSSIRRRIRLSDIYISLLSDVETFSELAELPSRSSPAASRHRPFSDLQESAHTELALSPERPTTSSTHHSTAGSNMQPQSPSSPDAMRASIVTADSDRFADAGDECFSPTVQSHDSELDIHPGDDNISWGSRRNKARAPAEDLWNSMASEDDLPDSLLLDRASTPRAPSTRSGSPLTSRTRREVSPYSRHLQSPGSWPRMEESHERISPRPSPGSWPTLDQSQHGMFASLDAKATSIEETVDNQQAALDAEISEQPEQLAPTEDLAASRVFSHEEAESMFMSAMSHRSLHVPGGWGSDTATSQASSPSSERRQPMLPQRQDGPAAAEDDPDLAYGEIPPGLDTARSGQATPRAASPASNEGPAAALRVESRQSEKNIAFIEHVSIWLPAALSDVQEEAASGKPAPRNFGDSFAPTGIPGTFSAYSDMSASRRQRSSSFVRDRGMSGSSFGESVQDKKKQQDLNVEVEVGAVACQFDVSCGRLLYRLSLLAANAAPQEPTGPSKKPTSDQTPTVNRPALTLTVCSAHLAFRERIGSDIYSASQSDHLLLFTIRDVSVLSGEGDLDVRFGGLEILLGSSRLLGFDKSREMRSSMVISDRTPDVTFKVSNGMTTTQRPVTELTMQTVSVDLSLDLTAFDDTFSSFGGLSGILEAGSSILSDSGVTSSPASPKIAKGVRFEGERLQTNARTEVKFNGRIGGVNAVLQGESCSVKLRTSTLKAVYREQGARANIEQAVVSGPHYFQESKTTAAPIAIDLRSAQVDYLTSPTEKDLHRLIDLLTPSKDKYDSEDDILIDTLIRQRKKGAVARVVIDDVKAKVGHWDSLSGLQDLAEELSKLSAVAKYLPEDERPGLLSTFRMKSVEARLPVNDRFGKAHVKLEDFHFAHVGLPALFALGIGDVRASQGGHTDIIHSLLPTEILPMVMMRTLGDEAEPIIKVKLFNICVEYSIPALLAATGMDEQAAPEEVMTELAKSVADFALPRDTTPSQPRPASSDSPSRAQKRTSIELLVHESAVGLQPHKLSSKGMLVLSDALFTTGVPPEDIVTAQLQLRKAAIFVADQVLQETAEEPLPGRAAPTNPATGAKLTSALSRRGFVSVGSIMAAQIGVKAVPSATSEGKTVDVDVRNELLLLETCADSTQTLIAILNGLAPPTPPSKQPKYLTEPMTIEDMMASFSGEPQVKQERPPETLFDAEEDPQDEEDALLDMPGFDEDDDGLLAESEMEASLYGPVSGMLEGVDKPEDEDDPNAFPETAESLLEDDPFEMPDTPADGRMSDAALVRELGKQCKPSISDQPVDLGLYEVEDLGFDALGRGAQQPLGSQHRFNTPAARTRTMQAGQTVELPFKLRVRDLHIIWNIYDGYDWQRTREGITEAVEQVEQKAEERKAKRRQSYNEREEEDSVIGDFLFNSIYIGVPSTHDAQELRRQINRGIDDLASETESVPVSGMSRPTTAYSASGRPLRQRPRRRLKLERSRAHKVAFELKGVSADVLVFPPDHPDTVNTIDLRVKDFEIFDNVPTSTWRKFLTHLESDPAAREMSKPMMHIEMLNVKTLEQYAASEIVMHVSVLPVRLHVDQDALDFITRFFEFKDQSMAGASSPNDQPFLQRVEVDTVDMRLDYKPKRVDYGGIRSGHYTEFKNFVILDGANIKLKHAIIYGIKGFEPLHQTLNDVWMPDIKRNQLPTVLAGLAPMRSLVNIGSGVRDVVAIPVREYKKDGRIVRSIQKGAMHFGKTTTSELARLGAKVAMGTQTLLTGAEGMLSPASASPRSGSGRRVASEQGRHEGAASDEESPEKRAISAYANQPLGVFSGLRSARRQLELDLLTAKDALIAVQGEVFDSATPGSAAAAVARHAPTVILRPVIGASRAVGTALLGVGNQIDRSNVRKIEDVSVRLLNSADAVLTRRTEVQAAIDCEQKRTETGEVGIAAALGSSKQTALHCISRYPGQRRHPIPSHMALRSRSCART